MRWLDVAGPPGAGKSELCDQLWPPRSIPLDWLHAAPAAWSPFLGVVHELLKKTESHVSGGTCRSMWIRSLAKMIAVHMRSDPRLYIQTGFAQRGLGIGWRLEDPEQIRPFYELMPVSAGVVILTGDVDEIQKRNRERGKDRSFMVPPIMRALEIARQVLASRGVAVDVIDTTRLTLSDARSQLCAIAGRAA